MIDWPKWILGVMLVIGETYLYYRTLEKNNKKDLPIMTVLIVAIGLSFVVLMLFAVAHTLGFIEG